MSHSGNSKQSQSQPRRSARDKKTVRHGASISSSGSDSGSTGDSCHSSEVSSSGNGADDDSRSQESIYTSDSEVQREFTERPVSEEETAASLSHSETQSSSVSWTGDHSDSGSTSESSSREDARDRYRSPVQKHKRSHTKKRHNHHRSDDRRRTSSHHHREKSSSRSAKRSHSRSRDRKSASSSGGGGSNSRSKIVKKPASTPQQPTTSLKKEKKHSQHKHDKHEKGSAHVAGRIDTLIPPSMLNLNLKGNTLHTIIERLADEAPKKYERVKQSVRALYDTGIVDRVPTVRTLFEELYMPIDAQADELCIERCVDTKHIPFYKLPDDFHNRNHVEKLFAEHAPPEEIDALKRRNCKNKVARRINWLVLNGKATLRTAKAQHACTEICIGQEAASSSSSTAAAAKTRPTATADAAFSKTVDDEEDEAQAQTKQEPQSEPQRECVLSVLQADTIRRYGLFTVQVIPGGGKHAPQITLSLIEKYAREKRNLLRLLQTFISANIRDARPRKGKSTNAGADATTTARSAQQQKKPSNNSTSSKKRKNPDDTPTTTVRPPPLPRALAQATQSPVVVSQQAKEDSLIHSEGDEDDDSDTDAMVAQQDEEMRTEQHLSLWQSNGEIEDERKRKLQHTHNTLTISDALKQAHASESKEKDEWSKTLRERLLKRENV
jgi:hypothetical protein